MGEVKTATDKASKKNSWFKGIKSEFKKIVWPDKESVTKQTTAVVIVTVILGVLIFFLDYFIDLGLSIFLG